MSRAATATPPQPYFPQRKSTPSMKHASSPNVSAAHFPTANRHQSSAPKRKTKNPPSSLVGALSRKSSKAEVQTVDALGLSFEDISSSAASASPSPPQSDKGQDTLMSEPGSYKHGEDVDPHGGRVTPAPSMTTSCSASFVATPLPTPSSSRAPSFLQPDPVVQDPASPTSPITNSAPRASWAPYFGKVAKAVVNTGMSMGIAFGEKRNKKDVPLAEPPVVQPAAASVDPCLARDAIYVPTAGTPRLTMEDLAHLDAEAAMEKRREWAMEQRRRITECARLCSQWPHSGYNQSKWGPTGSKHFYEPQSYSNPAHVATIMHKQAELERLITTNSATFFSCRHRRRGSSAESSTDPSVASYESSRSSPAHSMSLSADLTAAMASPLIGDNEVTSDTPHVTSSATNASPKSIKGVRSVSELDKLAECMALDSYGMDVDVEPLPQFAKSPTGLSATGTRPARAQSCGAKRPAACGVEEEEKRRKVDEAMVVEEAVATGVIQPGSGHRSLPCSGDKAMSASTPNLGTPGSAANSGNPAMFGHVVKTSDTHPIIISPFFPDELLPTISEQMVVPSSIYQMYSTADAPERPSSFILGSKIDVPSLLLSFIPPQMNPNAPLAASPAPHNRIESDRPRIGNLLLSSCPGKRLRMEGPVKGRGPICRDLATDLRRIKNEGVGCLVCCLDDTELALLGVPWETYLEVAAGTGLDVIRMPMPDGLTPVSLALFDSQVSLIATKYSLQGINVLVHCRGGVGRAGLTASAWAIKMGFVPPHPSLAIVEEAAVRQHDEQQARSGISAQSQEAVQLPAELEHQIVMSMVERVIAMIRSRRGLKAIESFEQVQFLVSYIKWIRANTAQATA